MTGPAARPDGRHARSAETNRRIIAATRALIIAGDNHPSAYRISRFAGLSMRTLYQHHRSLMDLYDAALDHEETLQAVNRRVPTDPKALALAFMGASRSAAEAVP